MLNYFIYSKEMDWDSTFAYPPSREELNQLNRARRPIEKEFRPQNVIPPPNNYMPYTSIGMPSNVTMVDNLAPNYFRQQFPNVEFDNGQFSSNHTHTNMREIHSPCVGSNCPHSQLPEKPASCSNVAQHILSCPFCAQYYKCEKTPYYLAIILLALLSIVLLKMVLEK
jgi:hypothetical protein